MLYDFKMKLSELLSLRELAYEYLLGALYSFKYKVGDDYLIIFASKIQQKTNHIPNIDDFSDQLKRASDFYKFDFLSILKPLNEIEQLENSKFETWIGYGLIVKNDIPKHNLNIEILKKMNVGKNKEHFLRGLFDSRSSIDTTAWYLSMDMRKDDSKWFAGNIYKMLITTFPHFRININPRFLQPGVESRAKNPQLRIVIFDYFGLLGTFRINYFEKAKIAKWWKKLNNGSIIPSSFDNLIKWDTSQLQNLIDVKKKPKIDELENDEEYSSSELSKDDKLSLYEYYLYQHERNQRQIPLNKNEIKRRAKLSNETVMNVLEKSNRNDFFAPTIETSKNKRGEPLLDIHHIIPHRYSYIFDEKHVIDQTENLIAITQNNHYLLHRGEFSEIKINMLQQMFEHVEVYLKTNNINISFEEFKSLY